MDVDIDALGDREPRRVASGPLELGAHDRHLLGELRGRLRAGAEEAVAEADRPPQRVGVIAADPDRGMGLLNRLRLHRGAVELPEATVETDPGLGPAGLHQREPLVEPRHQGTGVDPERGERPRAATGADADLDPAAAEVVKCADALGQVDRVVQRGNEHRTPEPQSLRACRRVAEQLARGQRPRRAEHLLLRPRALEPELLGAAQVGAERGGIEPVLVDVLGN